MPEYQKEAVSLIKAWLKKQKIKPIKALRHVYPRAYVLGKAGSSCITVVRPWVDAEKHLMQETKTNRAIDTITTFDPRLRAGDWCATAYVCHGGIQESVAVSWEA